MTALAVSGVTKRDACGMRQQPVRNRVRCLAFCLVLATVAACSHDTSPTKDAPAAVRNVLLVTIDTLRADRVGAYGYASARTPALDALARDGVRFDRAYATAPITLVSHASLLTGRLPPGHGARHNGIRIDPATPTLPEAFARSGFATGAFVAAFPVDRRFGLNKGFEAYGDTMPRDANGHLANDRPGRMVVDEAIAWLDAHRSTRFFAWVHLFEPHAPYGNPADPAQAARPAIDRYDDDVAEADAQTGRLITALGDRRSETLIVAAADHGEAFGEHGEISHSLFVYDTTLRVLLIVNGPGVDRGRVITNQVSLIDVAPTVASLAGLPKFDADGRVLELRNHAAETMDVRSLYAESFAPLLDFGWSPLRTIRRGNWKYIAAPRPELYDLAADPGETRNLIDDQPARAADLARQVDAISSPTLPDGGPPADREALARLQALGYVSGPHSDGRERVDPKDRREIAARIAEVTSGELQGPLLERALRDIVRDDRDNPQANLRLGYVMLESNRCAEAVKRFDRAIAGHLPGADAYLGRARCELEAKDVAAARRSLNSALAAEPDNPVVLANLGILLSDYGEPAKGIPYFLRALAIDPDLHQARFSLAIAYARVNQRADAAREAQELLRRLPPNAPQRPEIERLLAAVR
jgi:arylsulfatase A-like enzyme/Flp pilus assembly protein TadD